MSIVDEFVMMVSREVISWYPEHDRKEEEKEKRRRRRRRDRLVMWHGSGSGGNASQLSRVQDQGFWRSRAGLRSAVLHGPGWRHHRLLWLD